jgi:hypothetical protein
VPGEDVADVLGECFDADGREGSPSAHVSSVEPLVQLELPRGLPAVDVVEELFDAYSCCVGCPIE